MPPSPTLVLSTFLCGLARLAIPQELNVPVRIHPRLAVHTNLFTKTIYNVGNVYSPVGWGLANVLMIEGSYGWTSSIESAQHSAPEIHAGYQGWFDGDPLVINPVPRGEQARKLVALRGGLSYFERKTNFFLR